MPAKAARAIGPGTDVAVKACVTPEKSVVPWPLDWVALIEKVVEAPMSQEAPPGNTKSIIPETTPPSPKPPLSKTR